MVSFIDPVNISNEELHDLFIEIIINNKPHMHLFWFLNLNRIFSSKLLIHGNRLPRLINQNGKREKEILQI